MGHDDLVAFLERRPIELVETDEAAMQMMQIIPILVNVVRLAIQYELATIDAIAYSANSRAKVWVAAWLDTFESGGHYVIYHYKYCLIAIDSAPMRQLWTTELLN